MDIIFNICKDMQEPISYLPLGMCFGLMALCVCSAWEWYAGREQRSAKEERASKAESSRQRVRKTAVFLLGIYTTVIFQTAFFSREPGSRSGMDLGLFDTWGESAVSRAYVIENILMFIPLGILLPLLHGRFRNGWYCASAGLAISGLIEGMQLVTARGFFQIDDIATNVAGTIVGWGTVRILAEIHQHKKYCKNM